MSPLPLRMIQKKEVVLNSVAEFLGIWAVRGEASLSLNTKDGVTTITFSHSLSGHPEDPLHPPPAPTGAPAQRRRRRRHRGPARRERDRQRAARHQAAMACAPPASPPMASSPAATSTPEHLGDSGIGLGRSGIDTLTISTSDEKTQEQLFDCNICGETFQTEDALKTHMGTLEFCPHCGQPSYHWFNDSRTPCPGCCKPWHRG